MRSFYQCWIIGLLAICFVGCMGIKQPYIEKRQYVLEAKRPGAAASIAETALLRIRPFTAAPLTERSSFVYRMKENQYETDFYHVFLIPVNEQLTEIQRQWLIQAGFPVVQSSSRLEPQFVLENMLLDCSGDYRNPTNALAILEIETALVNNQDKTPKLVFQKSYRRAVALAEAAPDDLVQGWNEALAAILAELENDLRKQEAFK